MNVTHITRLNPEQESQLAAVELELDTPFSIVEINEVSEQVAFWFSNTQEFPCAIINAYKAKSKSQNTLRCMIQPLSDNIHMVKNENISELMRS